jgi:hypothetical protein
MKAPMRELKDEVLKKIAQDLTENLHKNRTVGWSQRESVRVKLGIHALTNLNRHGDARAFRFVGAISGVISARPIWPRGYG